MENPAQAISHLMQNRRSIYPTMYSGEPVPDMVIRQMLENANWAPTHKLTEPWRFVVFKGDGIRKLATFQAGLYKKTAVEAGNFQEEKYEKLLKKPLLCSHIIAIGMERHEMAKIPAVEEVCAVAAAVQNMWLTASAFKVGCYWSTGGVTFNEKAKPFFGLSKADQLLGFLYMGMPKEGKWPQGRRKPVADKVKWVDE